MRSVAPPHIDKIGVVSEFKLCLLRSKMLSILLSNRAGGSVYGVDIVMIAAMLSWGSKDVATTPPMECPRMTIEVFTG